MDFLDAIGERYGERSLAALLFGVPAVVFGGIALLVTRDPGFALGAAFMGSMLTVVGLMGAAEGRAPKRNASGPEAATSLEPAATAPETSTPVADEDDRAVLERDGWRCARCGQAIDPWRSWPDPLSGCVDRSWPASRDGVQPGGGRAAHLVCSQLADGRRDDTRAASAETPAGPAA